MHVQDGRTALNQACRNGQVAVVQLLLQRHADESIPHEVCMLA